MADESYENLLERGWDEIPEVHTLPVGTWRLRARNAVYRPAKSADNNPCILFIYKAIEPTDDVDEAAIAELGDEYDFEGNRIFARFWLETGADWDTVRNHLSKLGMDPSSYPSIEDSLKDVKGRDIMAYLDTRTFTDSSGELREENDPKNFASTDD